MREPEPKPKGREFSQKRSLPTQDFNSTRWYLLKRWGLLEHRNIRTIAACLMILAIVLPVTPDVQNDDLDYIPPPPSTIDPIPFLNIDLINPKPIITPTVTLTPLP